MSDALIDDVSEDDYDEEKSKGNVDLTKDRNNENSESRLVFETGGIVDRVRKIIRCNRTKYGVKIRNSHPVTLFWKSCTQKEGEELTVDLVVKVADRTVKMEEFTSLFKNQSI